ncbi:DUF2911 domain-containing protein [Spongiivirga citrea]|uniref:DUF2911 domain-containing protein n=1 Tax=Spongiivirga citrea TaxID=1481457 RepID=A0A6M0CJ59_9FLAO|nr:DUF2911 domain-containing protein [Spongiivirga citrea]NER16034.1 DUF2911 domain-containing protein [Spongiivirga citrea]
MKKFIVWTALILGILTLLFFFVFVPIMKSSTKKHSPEETITYTKNNNNIEVFYCRPYKKGREIFGGLIPLDEVWRTGANEATTFETKNDLSFNGETLPKGKYTLWTKPGLSSWQVIFNSELYGWGVSFGGVASRKPESDVLKITVPVQQVPEVEQFTISFEENPQAMTLSWDQTKISVPFQ